MTNFYAYVHARPDLSIFYVGKGKGSRSHELKGRGQHHQNIINKYGANEILIGKLECSSEKIAFDLERGLIKCLKRSRVTLANRTDGGEGTSGYKHTDEAKLKCAIAATGENNPFFGKKRPDHSKFLSGKKRPAQSAFMKARIAEFGAPMGMLGKTHSIDTLAKMRSHAPTIAKRNSELFKGVVKPEEQRAKMSKSASGHIWLHKEGKRTHCSEEKAKLLESQGWMRGQK